MHQKFGDKCHLLLQQMDPPPHWFKSKKDICTFPGKMSIMTLLHKTFFFPFLDQTESALDSLLKGNCRSNIYVVVNYII